MIDTQTMTDPTMTDPTIKLGMPHTITITGENLDRIKRFKVVHKDQSVCWLTPTVKSQSCDELVLEVTPVIAESPQLPTIHGSSFAPSDLSGARLNSARASSKGDSTATTRWTIVPTPDNLADFHLGITVSSPQCDPPQVCAVPPPFTITITIFVDITL